ncbi:MAG: cyclic nucleotide-binding domain-containing protein [Spirochaetes bacterium]|nr:cyclic nucleotide-binding domain-containing protein [Spirochaetota bacterium]
MEKSSLFQKYGQILEAGRDLFKEGDPGDTMYIIQKGRIKITKRVNNVEKILMVLGKGDFLGEMALIRQTPRTATATAIDNCELLSFNRNGFVSMISKNSSIAMNIIEKLCLRLEKADNQIRDLAKRDVKSLVISALNDLRRATKSPGEWEASSSLNYSETVRNISMQTNAPEDEVETQLGRLISSGFLAKDGNVLDIVNSEELDKLDGYFKR